VPQTEVEPDAEEKTFVEISKTLHARLKVIAAHRGLKLAEALGRFGGPGIDREYKRIVRELNEELGGEGG
jgi:effector-binding domain-containing protein